MSSLTQPLWIELRPEPFSISKSKQWPLITSDVRQFPEIIKLANSFLSTSSKFFSTRTSDPIGTLFLRYQPSIQGYRGIWLPENFPSLAELMKELLQVWEYDAKSFDDFIQKFFSLRLQEDALVNFQSPTNYNINLPPVFVLNQQQINGNLLHQLRTELNAGKDLDMTLLDSILEKTLPEQYRQLIDQIIGENEISIIHLIGSYLHSMEMISLNEYLHLSSILSQLSPHLADYVILKYLNSRILQGKIIPDDVISHLVEKEKESEGMLNIVILRVLTGHFSQQDKIFEQEKYLRFLMERASKYSWKPKIDLINSQIGLSRTSVERGDYFRAMTFYSFAKQGFTTLGKSSLSEEMEMEIEFQRISVLSASQLLQHGLYLLNHNDQSRNTLLILIDGIQSTLAHFIKYAHSVINMESVLAPLLQSATSSLSIYENNVNQLFENDLSFNDLNKTASLLGDSSNRQKMIPILQKHIEDLSFKDQKMIERISIFSEDGRHIGDYFMENGEFQPMPQDANQALFSSAMSAVSMLIAEATETDTGVEEISIGAKTVIYNQGDYVTFCLICNSSNSSLKQLLNSVVSTVEDKYEDTLKNWAGNLDIFHDLPELLTPLSFYTINRSSDER